MYNYRNRRLIEARSGNFNIRMRSTVLRFLRKLDRSDLTIQNTSSISVNWTVDVGKVDLLFEFEPAPDRYTINVKDSRGDKIELWAGEESELQADLEDTITFIDEFKKSTQEANLKNDSIEKLKESRRIRRY